MNKPRQQTITQGGDTAPDDATEELMDLIALLIAKRSLREPASGPPPLVNDERTDEKPKK